MGTSHSEWQRESVCMSMNKGEESVSERVYIY